MTVYYLIYVIVLGYGEFRVDHIPYQDQAACEFARQYLISNHIDFAACVEGPAPPRKK